MAETKAMVLVFYLVSISLFLCQTPRNKWLEFLERMVSSFGISFGLEREIGVVLLVLSPEHPAVPHFNLKTLEGPTRKPRHASVFRRRRNDNNSLRQ